MQGLALTYGTAPPPASKAASRFNIEDFGKIASASIELAPLTVLLGKNNTGKSYLASLIWALRGPVWSAFFSNSHINAPKKFRDFVKGTAITREPLVVEAKDCLKITNNWLDRNKNFFVSKVMNCDVCSVGKLSVEFDGHVFLRRGVKMPAWMSGASEFIKANNVWSLSFDAKSVGDKEAGMITAVPGSLPDELFLKVVEKLFSGSDSIPGHNPIYVPGARTGLVLSLRDIIKGSLGRLGRAPDPTESSSKFTMPVAQFLRTLVDTRSRYVPKTRAVAEFLSKSILGGQIHAEGEDAPNFEYQPANSEQRLPMHVVSSMVTELTPIITVLANTDLRTGVVIEEPEAHLHLSAQRCMARAIARLVNEGVPVVLTTHSDTFLQQLNILIRLHEKSDQFSSELGYERADLIDGSSVRAYELVENAGRSQCFPCDVGEDGIVAKSINETIIQMTDEIIKASAE